MVIWIIGMSASGKTTIGKKLFDNLLLSSEKWIFLDGDTFRNILGEDLGHSVEDRRKNAYRISRMCEFLSSQGINVVACVLSIFHENQQYNKESIKNYKEVYIDVEFDTLVKRDNKQLYSKALKGEIRDVVGVDIEFKPPYSPDLVIDNNLENPNYDQMIQSIIKEFDINIDDEYLYTSRDLLQYPHKYQYSKYEGKEFFIKYKDDREKALELFDYRIAKLSKCNATLVNSNHSYYQENDNLILKEYLLFLLNNDIDELEKQKSIIELLIKRFEVGKKLYLTYDLKEIKKSSALYDELLNYPLFSLVLQKYYQNTASQQKLVYFNALLKVNDIISSVKRDFIFMDELESSQKALRGELEIFGEWI